MIRRPVCVLLGLALTVLGCTDTRAVSCDDDIGAGADGGAATNLFARPQGAPCTRSATCNAGLECVPSGSVKRTGCEEPLQLTCEAPHRTDNAATRQLLIKGLNTSELSLTRELVEQERIPRFAWQRPDDATILVCGLFGCPPTFHREEQAGLDGGVSLQMVGTITNANECLISSAVYAQPPKVIDVRDVAPHERDPSAPQTEAREPATLRFGCWAYSRVAVIGATALERLEADEVPAQQASSSRCENADSDKESCTIAGAPFFGRCLKGACVASCVSSADCLALDDSWISDAGAQSDPEGRHCARARDAGAPECTGGGEP